MKNFLIIALAIVIGCDASDNSQTTVGEFQTLVDQKILGMSQQCNIFNSSA